MIKFFTENYSYTKAQALKNLSNEDKEILEELIKDIQTEVLKTVQN